MLFVVAWMPGIGQRSSEDYFEAAQEQDTERDGDAQDKEQQLPGQTEQVKTTTFSATFP